MDVFSPSERKFWKEFQPRAMAVIKMSQKVLSNANVVYF
ncbi:hypothetical protein COLO4_13579 [Corchorus olitorius]|uniref:Uncharacterized protein n=1 Tax=Corchorus olitorius TaxID=93759 RepID=A0A1R3JVV0_9ROSI|nr:hypothetical protein COLO4_13579 [Corchorus olitorius]